MIPPSFSTIRATSNLFSLVKSHLNNRLANTNDTLSQLDKIQQFILDLNVITTEAAKYTAAAAASAVRGGGGGGINGQATVGGVGGSAQPPGTAASGSTSATNQTVTLVIPESRY